MRERDEDHLTGALARATDGLRHEPELRAEWREEVLRQARAEREEQPIRSPRGTTSRRLSISIPWAIAAGLACALVGGGVARLASRPQAPAVVADTRNPASSPATDGAPTMLPVKFSIVAPNAARVSIVGDFNHWNPTTLPMKRSADGRLWEVEVRLPLGRYSYAFMIDGHLAADPDAPSSAGDDFGTPNSVLMVRGS
ncbi:MAG TPA: isoamylase early set domain-containing protein [Gemmatimonadaceae bacterium]|jgi:hypothetical protein